MFTEVLTQVIILFILMLLGVVLTKLNVISKVGVNNITDIVLYTVTPCVIIKSFIREFDTKTLKNLLLSFLVSFAVHTVLIIITRIALPSKDAARKGVLQFGTMFGNCGYMSLPLQQALLGDDGVFFCATFIAVFNIFSWTYGVFIVSGDRRNITAKKLIFNPGVISTVIGLIIFLCSIPIPKIVAEPIGYLAALNTPLPMIVIGYHLAQTKLLGVFKDVQCLWAIALRLILIPLCALGALYFCGIRGALLVSTVISCSAPTAANTTMFATKYNSDTSLSVGMVSLSTLLSLVTIPIIVSFAQSIA